MSAMLIAAPFVHVFPFYGLRQRCCWGRRESWFDENNIIIGVCGRCCGGGGSGSVDTTNGSDGGCGGCGGGSRGSGCGSGLPKGLLGKRDGFSFFDIAGDWVICQGFTLLLLLLA